MEENVGIREVTKADECVACRSHSITQMRKYIYVFAGDTVMFFQLNRLIMTKEEFMNEAVGHAGQS
jgi:hypothetical protein